MQEEKEYVFQPQINKRFVKKPLIKSTNDLYIIEFDDYMKQIQDGVVKLKTSQMLQTCELKSIPISCKSLPLLSPDLLHSGVLCIGH